MENVEVPGGLPIPEETGATEGSRSRKNSYQIDPSAPYEPPLYPSAVAPGHYTGEEHASHNVQNPPAIGFVHGPQVNNVPPMQQVHSSQTVQRSRKPFSASTADLCTSRIEICISARNLLDRDTFSKSDPVCVIYSKDTKTNQYFEVGRTDRVKNCLNPDWNKKFALDYRFEERQIFKFAIYDWDGAATNLSAHDYLGCLECSLGEIVAAPKRKFERNLELPLGYTGKASQILIFSEEIGDCKKVLLMRLSAKNLDKKDLFGKSDPYVMVEKKHDDESWVTVHKTEVKKNTLNPDWNPFSIRVASLISGNPERPIRFQVWDWDRDGSSDFIGEFETTYLELRDVYGLNKCSVPVINPKKKEKKKSYTNSGSINFESIKIEEERTFLDYIQSGVQLHFTVAVDFTASNGNPNHQDSLHYRNPSANTDNQYSLAIKSIGEIIQDYDSDKQFPALGFGAKLPNTNCVCHEFFLNGKSNDPFCHGVQGVLEAYYRTLNTVQLYGPTYFAPVINHVARMARSYRDGRNYFVLLIITDGVICDMEATKDAIIYASVLPMSIIIVGVGNEDFSAMEFLDSDGKLLSRNGKTAVRDIVQFVELRKFMMPGQQSANCNQNPMVYSKVSLSRDVLAELPEQLIHWMKNYHRYRT